MRNICVVEKYNITDSVLDRYKIIKLVFFLHEAWFTFIKNVNNQNNWCWLLQKFPCNSVCFPYIMLQCSECTQTTGPVLFEETNSKHYVKLILIPLLRNSQNRHHFSQCSKLSLAHYLIWFQMCVCIHVCTCICLYLCTYTRIWIILNINLKTVTDHLPCSPCIHK